MICCFCDIAEASDFSLKDLAYSLLLFNLMMDNLSPEFSTMSCLYLATTTALFNILSHKEKQVEYSSFQIQDKRKIPNYQRFKLRHSKPIPLCLSLIFFVCFSFPSCSSEYLKASKFKTIKVNFSHLRASHNCTGIHIWYYLAYCSVFVLVLFFTQITVLRSYHVL
jgi:hypothetical protein